MPDIPYNRPANRRPYLSITKHMKSARNKHSKWLSVAIERLTFDNGDYGNFTHLDGGIAWLDNGGMWGFLQNYEKLGTAEEQFGYFVEPENLNDPWHGYPAIPFSKPRLNISTILIERWVEEGVLDQDDVPALLNKRRL